MRLLFFLLFLPSALLAEASVPHLASSARLFLRVPEESPPITDVRISSGQALPGNYESTPEKRARLTDITFPIHWWRWTKVEVSFTPTYDGAIELDLNGPWGEARPGVLQQMEVLWQNLSAVGSTIENPNFSRNDEDAPTGWKSPWKPYPAPNVWPFTAPEPAKGATFGASWHGRPLTQSIPVKKGVAVTLKLEALGARPPGFVGMERQTEKGPAHIVAAKLKRGVNLGNNWESPPGEWGIKFDTGDLDQIAAEGFDHIRVPVAWQHRLKDGVLDPTFLAEIEPMLRHALSKQLRIILNWQHYDELSRDPEGKRAEFMRVWGLIANHFKTWPPELMFELINEPNTKMDGAMMTRVYEEAITTIRRTNPSRTILVDPPQWASWSALDRLVLPKTDSNLIVSIHCYDPFEFTHQGASWVGLTDLKGITYPGPPSSPVTLPASLRDAQDRALWVKDYNRLPTSENPCSMKSIERTLDEAILWSNHFNRPIHLGEFGSNRMADQASRIRYSRDVRTAAETRKIPWSLWEWKAGFGYWDPQTNKPLLREALFGK